MQTRIDVIPLEELDEFSGLVHKAPSVPSPIQQLSMQMQEHWTWKSRDATTPPNLLVENPHSECRGLKSVEFNPTELCNRTCHFCPRVDPEVYPNRKLHMQPETVQRVVDNLKEHQYCGKIVFSGMGEPTLNRKICELIKICTDAGIYTELVTNGDKIYQDKWYNIKDFIDAGVNHMHIDVYDDKDQLLNYIEMAKPYTKYTNFNITPRFLMATGMFNNRAGDVKHSDIDSFGMAEPCHAPSVKAFIDWDGTVQLCCHDWQRAGGNFGNVNEEKFTDIWNGESMLKIRGRLMYNKRTDCGAPCNGCNTGGNMGDRKKAIQAWSLKIDKNQYSTN